MRTTYSVVRSLTYSGFSLGQECMIIFVGRARGKSQQIRHFCAGGDFASYANPLVFFDTDFVKRRLLRAAHRETAGKSRFCAIFGSICAPSSAHLTPDARDAHEGGCRENLKPRPTAGSVASRFFGLKAALLAIVLQAVH